MICPECGERYNFYEPRCPWCGAAKPVEKEKPDEGEKSLGYQVEKAPEKEILLTYKCQKEYKGKFRIVSNYISFAVCLLVFFVIMGVIAVEPVGIKGWFFLFCFFIGCFFIDEHDFPEVVEMMDKLYFGKGRFF